MSKTSTSVSKSRRARLDVSVEKLFLDKENPRLPEEAQGKREDELLKVLYRGFNLDEIAESMAQNGYFDEEPLVVIPQNMPKKFVRVDPNNASYLAFIKKANTKFTVVEGNRRLAAVKLLLESGLREQLRVKHWPALSNELLTNLRNLPVIVYSKRVEVVPYLGVRHIVGIQKWDSYAKARYVAALVDEGRTLKEVEAQIGDTQGSARRNYISYKLVAQVEDEFDYNTEAAKKSFSLLILAIGQGKIKRFLGLPTKLKETDVDAPVPKKEINNLKYLMSWLFGDDRNKPVIDESRDITRYLSHVVDSQEALKHLKLNRDLEAAYDLSDGEERMVLRYLANANSKLTGVLGLIHRHKTEDVIGEVEKCAETAGRLLKTVKEA